MKFPFLVLILSFQYNIPNIQNILLVKYRGNIASNRMAGTIGGICTEVEGSRHKQFEGICLQSEGKHQILPFPNSSFQNCHIIPDTT
jgi:hypothetical protein